MAVRKQDTPQSPPDSVIPFQSCRRLPCRIFPPVFASDIFCLGILGLFLSDCSFREVLFPRDLLGTELTDEGGVEKGQCPAGILRNFFLRNRFHY